MSKYPAESQYRNKLCRACCSASAHSLRSSHAHFGKMGNHRSRSYIDWRKKDTDRSKIDQELETVTIYHRLKIELATIEKCQSLQARYR